MSILDITPRAVGQWFSQQRVKNWMLFLVISGIVWTFVPTNFLLFFPLVIFWILICLAIATFLMSLYTSSIEDD